jgi:phage terminase Nu1 subunit (DNA packaging protein)
MRYKKITQEALNMDKSLNDLLMNKEDLINTNQLMEAYQVKRITIERWRREGLPFTKINNKIFFKNTEVINWITENKTDQLL